MIGIRIFRTSLLTLFIFLVTVPLLYSGTVPQMINYQGTLTTASGTPVPDGQYAVVFSIYDVASGGTALWTETWNSSTSPVTTIGGNFNVLLGTYNPIPLNFFTSHSVTYLGIKVGNDQEALPRQRIASAAYALTAGTGGIPSGGIIMWSGAISQIPEGWALCNGQNGTPDLRDRFIAGAGNSYAVGTTGGVASNNISHTHTGPSHSHSVSSDGSHSHTYSGTTGIESDTDKPDNGCCGSDETVAANNHTHSYSGTTPASGSHSHGGVTGAAGSDQTGSSGSTSLENRPPYFALAFIMKL